MGIIPTEVLEDEMGCGSKIEIEDLKPKPDNDVLLIVGDARGVYDDLGEFLDMAPLRFDTMCINYSVKLIPWKVEHFVAGDSHMKDMQALAMTVNGAVKHCWNPGGLSIGFDVRWVRDLSGGWNGTTGNLAVQIGIQLGYIRIILAGMPMDQSGNWYTDQLPDNDVKRDKNHADHLWKWTEISLRPKAKFIRSLSGNTADLFGKPDVGWLTKHVGG